MRDVELLELLEPAEGGGEGADEGVEADVEDGEVEEIADGVWEAGGEGGVEEDELGEGPGHGGDGGGEAAGDGVVGQDEDGDGGVAEVGREGEVEVVVVEEERIEGEVEDSARNLAGEPAVLDFM